MEQLDGDAGTVAAAGGARVGAPDGLLVPNSRHAIQDAQLEVRIRPLVSHPFCRSAVIQV